MTLAPGTRLGPYEITAPLGAGGMGEVFRARDTRLGREVAIKALPAEFARDPERRERFEREARLLASLNHPIIAAIYGLEDSGGAPHLVLELVDGVSLAERLAAQGALPPGEALALCVQVAAAIEAAHERGIVHRDLKPGNVMITPQGVAKVLDFGLARADAPAAGAAAGASPSDSPTMLGSGGVSVAGVILGTAAYMSPEQARGKPVDRRSDVWSFGCVLFECLTGRAAFAGETVSDLIARVLEREPDWASLPVGVPPRVRDVLRRCLRKDAAERPRDIRDVRLELAEAAAAGIAGIAGGAKAAAREQSIAVLPFENLSGPDDEYFSDGITDEIMNALAQLEGLRVAARTSCFAFKGRREDLRTVGEKLDVATVLEGTVRRSGARLRITVQMVKVADGYQMWSERYDREMTDVFAVQDEIAGAVAERLRVTFHGGGDGKGGSVVRRGTESIEAYELFLKGRALQYRRGGSILDAIPCFERAIELDPGYVDALAWLADSYRLLGTYGAAPAAEVMPRARAAAERALALDPDDAEALSTLADVAIQYDRDGARAAALWARVLAKDPRNSRTLCERALWQVGGGTMAPEQAAIETALAAEADPLNSWVAGMRSYMLGFVGRSAEAIAEAERAMEIDPGSYFARYCEAQAHAWAGDYERTLEVLPRLLASSGRHVWALALLGWTYGKLGRAREARAVHDELVGRANHDFVGPVWLATTACAAGQGDEAVRFLQRAVVQRDPVALMLRFMVHFDGLRALPGFEEIVRELWSGAGEGVK